MTPFISQSGAVGRRSILAAMASVVGLAATACSSSDRGSDAAGSSDAVSSSGASTSTGAAGWAMPEESSSHERTWMSFAVSDDIWGENLAEGARKALVDIANAISEFEPVHVIVPPGTARPDVAEGVAFVSGAADDLWMRDTGPTFVTQDGEVAGVDFNFNGWGGHQEHAQDAKVAAEVCTSADVERHTTKLVLEGGALEVDGEGTAIITESCVLNTDRNPGWSKARVEKELERTIGVKKVIWLPGIAGKDITDGHTDFYARFTKPGVVVAGREDDPSAYDYHVTRKHLDILRKATDARGRKLEVHVIPGPSDLRKGYLNDSFAAGYINFFVCNGGVIAPQFGDADADDVAKSTLEQLFPDRKVVQLDIDPIAAGGGGIHCTTQQQPKGKA